jgi:hypothetical protein
MTREKSGTPSWNFFQMNIDEMTTSDILLEFPIETRTMVMRKKSGKFSWSFRSIKDNAAN